MAQKSLYGDRYCAFVDILGFRQLVDQLPQEEAHFDALYNLLKRVHGAHSGAALDVDDTDFLAQSISDAVAISTRVNGAGLAQVFSSLQSLALDLLVEGYFVRGAVVRSPLYHDQQMVFGEALVRAYEFESKVAKFPRIVISREVREDIIRFSAASGPPRIVSMMSLRKSSDGPMYLDVLQPIVALLDRKESPFKSLTSKELATYGRYVGIRDKIQSRYEEAMDHPDRFEKIRWFARYWNKAIPSKYNLQIRDADQQF